MTLAIVSMNQTLFNKKIANVTCWDNFSEDSSWLQDFADRLRDSANDTWDNYMVTNWTLDNITVSFIEGSIITYSVDVPFTQGDLQGNQLGDGMAPSVAMLMSTRNVGPAPNRGRIYFSGFSESWGGDGQWDNQALIAFKGMVEEWAAGFNIQGQNTSLQILRRPSNKFPTYVANPVQIVNRRDQTKSQRRRNL